MNRRFPLLAALLLFLPGGEFALCQTELTGTWASTDPPAVLQLHQRTDGTVLGYLPGADPFIAGRTEACGVGPKH